MKFLIAGCLLMSVGCGPISPGTPSTCNEISVVSSIKSERNQEDEGDVSKKKEVDDNILLLYRMMSSF
ncbi:MAG: hypothetical protein ACKVOW_08435 [Chitinophagaceae bacterium]